MEERGKVGRNGKNWEGSFTLPHLTDRAGYATVLSVPDVYSAASYLRNLEQQPWPALLHLRYQIHKFLLHACLL